MSRQKKYLGIGCALLSAFTLAGCGGSSSSGSGGSNNAPVFAAPSPATALEDQAFTFNLTADDADGDTITFSATGLPAWLNLDVTTGRLSGIPVREDVGINQGITLSASDGEEVVSVPFEIEVLQTENIIISGLTAGVPLANALVTVNVIAQQDAIAQTTKSQLQRKLGYAKANNLTDATVTSPKLTENSIQTTSDDNGNFEFTLTLVAGEFTGNELLEIRIVGAGDQSQVEYISQVGDIDYILAATAGDELLSSEDLERLSVSPLTTALSILARDFNDNQTLVDWDELQAIEMSLEADEVIELANTLTLLIQTGAVVEVGSTILESYLSSEQASDEVTMSLLAANNFLDESGELIESIRAQLQFIEDQNLNNLLFSDTILERLTAGAIVWSNTFVPGHHPAIFSPVINLSEDGTGEVNISSDRVFNWEITESGALVFRTTDERGLAEPLNAFLFPGLLTSIGFSDEIVSFLSNSGSTFDLTFDIETESLSAQLVSVNEHSITLDVDHVVNISLDTELGNLGFTGELQTVTVSGQLDGPRVIITEPDIEFSDNDFIGNSWAILVNLELPIFNDGETGTFEAHDLFDFNEDGTTNLGLQSSESGTWSISGGKLAFDFGGETFTYTPLVQTPDDIFVLQEVIGEDGEVSYSSINMSRVIEENREQFGIDFIRPAPTPTSAEYWASGDIFASSSDFFVDDNLLSFINFFGYFFPRGDENIATRVFSNASSEVCLADVDVSCFFVETDGVAERNLLINGTQIQLERDTDRDSSDSVRIWEVLSYDLEENRAIVLETRFFGTLGNLRAVLVPPRINSLQLRDLVDDFPSEYATGIDFNP